MSTLIDTICTLMAQARELCMPVYPGVGVSVLQPVRHRATGCAQRIRR